MYRKTRQKKNKEIDIEQYKPSKSNRHLLNILCSSRTHILFKVTWKVFQDTPYVRP